MSQSAPPSSVTEVSESVVASEAQASGKAQEQSTEPNPTDAPIQAQPQPPRKIDENTDINTLTDEEIRQLNEQAVTNAMQVQDKRPLVSFPTPISLLLAEYDDPSTSSQNVVKKLAKLQQDGWDMVWRARGDGDCFYRSFILAYLLRILHSESTQLQANLAFSNVQSALPLLTQANFQMDILEDFLQPLLDQLKKLEDDDNSPTEWEIVTALQDSEASNSMVVLLRYLTSAYIRTHAEAFEPFLMHPENFTPLDATDFCQTWVEPIGKEADQVMIQALARALKQGIRICYLDGSSVEEDGGANFVDFEVAEGEGVGEDPLMLLYRPGHYDVLAPVSAPPAA